VPIGRGSVDQARRAACRWSKPGATPLPLHRDWQTPERPFIARSRKENFVSSTNRRVAARSAEIRSTAAASIASHHYAGAHAHGGTRDLSGGRQSAVFSSPRDERRISGVLPVPSPAASVSRFGPPCKRLASGLIVPPRADSDEAMIVDWAITSLRGARASANSKPKGIAGGSGQLGYAEFTAKYLTGAGRLRIPGLSRRSTLNRPHLHARAIQRDDSQPLRAQVRHPKPSVL